MNQTVLTLTPGSRPLGLTLGFTAVTVIVDNYTSSYLQLTDAGKTIPPWTYGAVVSLPDGIRQANAKLVPTVPAVAGPPVPASQATLTWTDQPLPADPGHLLQQSAYQQQQVLSHPSVAANAVSTTTVTPPAGTMAIGWQIDSLAADGQGPSAVVISGQQSGTVVGGWSFPFSGQGLFAVPLSPVDTSLTIIVTARVAAGCSIYVIAWSAAPAAPLPTTVQASNGGELLAVSEQLSPVPAVWQDSVITDWQLIDTARVLTVPASAGLRVVVAEAVFTAVAAAGGGAAIPACRIWDGASGSTQVWTSRVGVAVAGNADRAIAHRVRGTAGAAMTMDFDSAPPANDFFFIAASGWYR